MPSKHSLSTDRNSYSFHDIGEKKEVVRRTNLGIDGRLLLLFAAITIAALRRWRCGRFTTCSSLRRRSISTSCWWSTSASLWSANRFFNDSNFFFLIIVILRFVRRLGSLVLLRRTRVFVFVGVRLFSYG